MFETIKEKIVEYFAKDFLGSHKRGVVKFLSGFLSSHGVADALAGNFAAAAVEVGISLVVYAIAQAFSNKEIAKTEDKVEKLADEKVNQVLNAELPPARR